MHFRLPPSPPFAAAAPGLAPSARPVGSIDRRARPHYAAAIAPFILADVVWASLFVTYSFYASGAILVGLLVECLVFRFWLHFSWPKAALASLVVNAISALLGVILLALSGIVWEFTGGVLLWFVGHVGTFNPVTWTVSWLLVVVVNGLVEFWPLVWVFRAERSWRLLGIVLVANAASVAFAASFFIPPLRA